MGAGLDFSFFPKHPEVSMKLPGMHLKFVSRVHHPMVGQENEKVYRLKSHRIGTIKNLDVGEIVDTR